MLNARKGWIGIDLGTRSVKLAQVEREPSGLRLREALVVPRLSSDVNMSQKGSFQSARSEISQALALKRGFASRRAACALSMHWCHVNFLTIPTGSRTEQRSIVERELGFAGAEEKMAQEFAFWPAISSQEDEAPAAETVVTVSVARDSAIQAGRDVYHAGLVCEALDGLPLALGRAVQMTPEGSDNVPLAALDWGFTGATLCLVRDGLPVYVRKLRNCGFRRVLHTLASSIGLALEEVEAALTERAPRESSGRDNPRHHLQEALHEVAVEPLRNVEDELVKTWDFLRRHHREIIPEKLFLFGAGALWTHAATYLSSRVKLPVENWGLANAGITAGPDQNFPAEVLAPAIALSSLAWAKR